MSTAGTTTAPAGDHPRRLGRVEGEAVISPSGARLLLNDTAAAVWELCDGQTQVGEIVGAMGELYDAPLALIERDVCAALEELDRLGLVARGGESP